MTVIVKRNGRWAGVDYSAEQSVTNSAIERDMVNGGFARWAAGSEPGGSSSLVTVSPSGTIDDPVQQGAVRGASIGAAMCFDSGLIGDSISDRAFTVSSNILHYSQPYGYAKWAVGLSGQRLRYTADYAKAGSGCTSSTSGIHPTAQEQAASVIAAGVTRTTVLTGINDLINGAAASAVLSSMTALVSTLTGAGVRVDLCTLTPISTSYAGYSSAKQSAVLWLNQQIRLLAVAGFKRGIRLVDTFAQVVDPTSAACDWKAGYTIDGLHPSNRGAYYMGKELARIWSLDVPAAPVLVSSAGDARLDPSGSTLFSTATNIIRNGMFALGTPVSGLAQGWTTSLTGGAAVTPSIVADPNGFGNRQRLSCTFSAAGDAVLLTSPNMTAAVDLAKKVLGFAEVTVGATPTGLKNVRSRIKGTGTPANPDSLWSFGDSSDVALLEGFTEVHAVDLDFSLSDQTDVAGGLFYYLLIEASGAGSAVVDLGRVSVINY